MRTRAPVIIDLYSDLETNVATIQGEDNLALMNVIVSYCPQPRPNVVVSRWSPFGLRR